MRDIDALLELAAAKSERRASLCGGIVVAGLVIEVVLAIVFRGHSSWVENWAPVIADFLVALGVVGEIHFARLAARSQEVLRRLSNEKLSAANTLAAMAIERSAKLEKEAADARERTAEIERLTSWRHISREQFLQILESLQGRIASCDIVVEHERSDMEAMSYAREVERLLVTAGPKSLRTCPNSYSGLAVGLNVVCGPGIDVEIFAAAFTRAGLQLGTFNKDLSTHFADGTDQPNVYFFVAPKPPPALPVMRFPFDPIAGRHNA